MYFALIGDHPDGLDMARSLVETGRHQLVIYNGPAIGTERLLRSNLTPRKVGDLEEALADPQIEAVIVAGSRHDRAAQLRRALQSEHHVLCVHPADYTPDTAYEADMIRKDTGKVLFPLLPESLHPAVARLHELVSGTRGESSLFIEIERHATEQVLLETDEAGRAGFPCWDILRALGGDIGEVLAFAETEHVAGDQPILVSGRFVQGGLFQEKLLPNEADSRLQIGVATRDKNYELLFPVGFPGPAKLTWTDDAGERREESWPEWNPWPAQVEAFERLLQPRRRSELVVATGGEHHITVQPSSSPLPSLAWRKLTWTDEFRALELDAAARRSLEHRRASSLDFQEVTEEASFKGTMTLAGCGLLWISLVLLIFSIWIPWLGWAILPLFTLFLVLQSLRWIVPGERQKTQQPP